MEEKITNLFVYGSLRRCFHVGAYAYISKYFTLIGEAKVKGNLYAGEYPAAIPCTDEGFIIGELYELKKQAEFSWVIAQLDDYEGTNPAAGEEQLYRREITEVFLNERESLAWIYWFNGNINGKILIPSGDILNYICSVSK